MTIYITVPELINAHKDTDRRGFTGIPETKCYVKNNSSDIYCVYYLDRSGFKIAITALAIINHNIVMREFH